MDKNTIIKLASLCKLHLSDQEIEKYLEQCKAFLGYAQDLNNASADDIEPYLPPITNNLRDDEIDNSRYISKEELLKLAANSDTNYILVPKVIG